MSAQSFVPSRPPLRGSPKRHTDMMEALQLSYLRAVAASAGCVISGVPEIDEGVDVTLTHTSDKHTLPDRVARLEIQMKATGMRANSRNGRLLSRMSRDRYNYYATENPTVHKIVVILSMPGRQDHWTFSRPKALSIHYCAYWVNLAGSGQTNAKRPFVAVPTTNVFDDVALCDMMERIGMGGQP